MLLEMCSVVFQMQTYLKKKGNEWVKLRIKENTDLKVNDFFG